VILTSPANGASDTAPATIGSGGQRHGQRQHDHQGAVLSRQHAVGRGLDRALQLHLEQRERRQLQPERAGRVWHGSTVASPAVSVRRRRRALLRADPGCRFGHDHRALRRHQRHRLTTSLHERHLPAGRAAYTFTISTTGDYLVSAPVNAPDESANSFFVNIDAEPTDPEMTWDIPLTSGLTERTVSWRGNGTFDNAQFTPKVFNLSAGTHTLIVRGPRSQRPVGARSLSYLMERMLHRSSRSRATACPVRCARSRVTTCKSPGPACQAKSIAWPTRMISRIRTGFDLSGNHLCHGHNHFVDGYHVRRVHAALLLGLHDKLAGPQRGCPRSCTSTPVRRTTVASAGGGGHVPSGPTPVWGGRTRRGFSEPP